MKTVTGDNSHFDQFVRDRLIKDQSAETGATDLYEWYLAWCDQKNVRRWSQKALGVALAERGFERRKCSTVVWIGVALRE